MSRQPPARRRVIMDSDEELGQKGNSGDSEAIRVSSWFTIKYLVFVSLLEVLNEQKALVLEIVYLVTSICNVMLRLVRLAIW